jgi:hypothetical protein
MKIKGKYCKIGNSIDCEVELLEGIISISAASGLDYAKINMPADNVKLKLKKVKRNENKILDKTIYSVYHVETRPMHKMKIEYVDKNGDVQKIFINPTTDEIIEIKSQRNKFWILQPDVQKNLLYLAIGGSIAAAIAILL